MAGESPSPSVLLLCRTLSAQSSSCAVLSDVIALWTETGRRSLNVLCAYKSECFVRNEPACLLCLSGYFTFIS
jgi:hypothetical protein